MPLELGPRYMNMLQAVLREHAPFCEVWAFGSRVNGSSHDGSDLDLIIRNPQKLAAEFSDLGRLRTAFEESNLPMLLDVFDWARLPPEFRAEIERQHVVVQAGMSK